MIRYATFIVRLYIHEVAWRARMWLTARLIGGRVAPILDGIRKHGVYRVPGYFSEAEMKIIEAEINAAVADAETHEPRKSTPALYGIYRRWGEGAFRLYDLDKSFPVLRRYAQDAFVIFINTVSRLKFQFPTVMYAYTESRNELPPGRFCHTDQWFHQLKLYVPVVDCGAENGPLMVYPGSGSVHPRLWRYYYERYRKGEKWWIDESEMVRLAATCGTVQATGKRGDAYFFDTRTFHLATKVNQGARRIFWYYF